MITRNCTTDIPSAAIISARWRTHIDPLATPTQRHWLKRPGALTAGLRGLGTLELRVLRESITLPWPDESMAMQLAPNAPVHVREICMSINGVDCVVARSVVDCQGWAGSWKAIRGLGRRPLADLLYDDPRVSRSMFETARLRIPHPLARLAIKASRGLESPTSLARPADDAPLPARYAINQARRSVFWRHTDPLLVAECFLPAFWRMIGHARTTSR